ncbi:phenylalanine--tRNA ligase subunit beta [Hydrogenimonas sp.]
MIVTRTWLEEWVDLDGISTDEICKKLNSIGLEVDALKRIRIPEKIVVGFVKSCEKHPDADKLNVCQIDIGTGVKQIVCGAKNIREGLYVPVATIGAVMPDGMKIKHAKLRGVESDGMVCSAKELGLPAFGEGILELDESIGALIPGKALCGFAPLQEDIIEIELTANRGDCLSINGVARELSVAFERPMKTLDLQLEEKSDLGIGRILQFIHEGRPHVSLVYRAVDSKSLTVPLLIRLRLAFVEQEFATTIDAFTSYAIHATGVILRDYGFSKLVQSEKEEKVKLVLKELPDHLGAIEVNGKTVSIVGVRQDPECRADENEHTFLLEASYVAPHIIAPAVKNEKLKTDPLYYRTSRGSEPDLDFGLNYLLKILADYGSIDIYAGCSEYLTEYEPVTLKISTEEIAALIGEEIELSVVVGILSRLAFRILRTEGDEVILEAPAFRHDIENAQDVIEEIVRIIGIDNIPSKPLCFTEANRETDALARHRFLRDIRLKAVGNGFFETIHYVFCDNKRVKELGFKEILTSKALLNPITSEMDGLRPSLMVSMLDSLQRNVRMSQRRIPLFEIGTVFDEKRDESLHFGLVYSGEKESEEVANAGKPSMIDFASFADKVAAVIGCFELVECTVQNGLIHPYQSADMMIDGKKVGVLSKLHPTVAEKYDLPDTYFAEIDLAYLKPRHIRAKAISAFTPMQRDISIVVPQSTTYALIEKALASALPAEVKTFYPIDRYVDDALGDMMSLTIRFVISSMEKTLDENEINAIMEKILDLLQDNFKATLR